MAMWMALVYLAALAAMAAAEGPSSGRHPEGHPPKHGVHNVAVEAEPNSPPRWGYHGPYYPRPGGPYPMVGCDVLRHQHEHGSPLSALPLPEGKRWWHDYNSGLPDHLVDVSKHSIVLTRKDLEGWIVPDSIDVLPPPPEFLNETELRAPFREEYASWLEKHQTAGSIAWHLEHPEGLPYIPPNIGPAPRIWRDRLPEHLREVEKNGPITWGADGDNWIQPGTVDFPRRHGQQLSDDEVELKQWIEDHLTEGYGVATAHRQLEMRCRDEAAPALAPAPEEGSDVQHGPGHEHEHEHAGHHDTNVPEQTPATEDNVSSQLALTIGDSSFFDRWIASSKRIVTSHIFWISFITTFVLGVAHTRRARRRARAARLQLDQEQGDLLAKDTEDRLGSDGAIAPLLGKA
ncbi:hypothetical protein EHS25_000210 [Saitozyma podzolica]|uniref:Uncharacterized protein n=1 Tax=Saitozyma podzolica TaxID=1890683 RepID=A0A427YVF8_9TREE|nr:hypothetical protein EHS25_000210 [Saitozyma podzolica]